MSGGGPRLDVAASLRGCATAGTAAEDGDGLTNEYCRTWPFCIARHRHISSSLALREKGFLDLALFTLPDNLISAPMKDWAIIADKLSKAGWSWGYSTHIDSTGRVLFTADAHRDDGKGFIVSADEKLTAQT